MKPKIILWLTKLYSYLMKPIFLKYLTISIMLLLYHRLMQWFWETKQNDVINMFLYYQLKGSCKNKQIIKKIWKQIK